MSYHSFRAKKKHDGEDVYQIFRSMKLHFSSLNYDASQYQYKNKRFTLENRSDRYSFEKLANSTSNRDLIIDYIAANFMFSDNSLYSGTELSDDHYKRLLKYRQSQLYLFKDDLNYIVSQEDSDELNKHLISIDNQLPTVIQYYLSNDIHLETVVILHKLTKFMDNIPSTCSPLLWDEVKIKILKSQPFVIVKDPKPLVKAIINIFSG